jgi:5-bromo-4-chloroindolyl phosphate hydrolysis protein
MGLDFLRVFYHVASLAYGTTQLMILLTLVGSFLAMTGIILHSISKMMNEFKVEIEQIKKASRVHGHNAGNGARDN